MIKLFLTLIVAALAVSARAQETVGGLVIGQTYDYDYIISVLGEPDYVSHDMYEFTSSLCTKRNVCQPKPKLCL